MMARRRHVPPADDRPGRLFRRAREKDICAEMEGGSRTEEREVEGVDYS